MILTPPAPGAPRRPQAKAFSLPEILVTVAIIGILAAIGIPSISNVMKPSKEAVARNLTETLNQAVVKFNHSHYTLQVSAGGTTGVDEMAVLQVLQYRNPDPEKAKAGTPYMNPRWTPAISSSSLDYRIAWAGESFTILSPGTSGAGFKVDFEGRDM